MKRRDFLKTTAIFGGTVPFSIRTRSRPGQCSQEGRCHLAGRQPRRLAGAGEMDHTDCL